MTLTQITETLDLAACNACLNQAQYEAIVTYLMVTKAGLTGDPADLLALAKCYLCYDQRLFNAVELYLLCSILGIYPGCDPATILALQPCLECMDDNEARMLTVELLCEWVGETPTPPAQHGIRGEGTGEDILGEGGELILEE